MVMTRDDAYGDYDSDEHADVEDEVGGCFEENPSQEQEFSENTKDFLQPQNRSESKQGQQGRGFVSKQRTRAS